jgi:hypothetical protein
LNQTELKLLFDYNYFIKHVDSIFMRLGLDVKKKGQVIKRQKKYIPHAL